MNIGLFSDTYYPEINGVANSVFVLKKSLEERGHNVYVFTTTTPGSPEYEYNVFRVHSLPFVLMKDRRVGMLYQRRLANMIRRLNLDVIHTHTEFSLRIFANIMAKELNIPVVHTYHTIYEDYTHYFAPFKPLDKGAKAFARKYTKKVCNEVEEVIAPTNKTKVLLEQYSVYKNINVIPTGVSFDKFRPEQYDSLKVEEIKKQYGIAKDDKVMLYIGRVSPEKNIQEIIKDLPEYMKEHQNLKFAIVGDGPDHENLRTLVSELHLEKQVIFLGEKPWDTIGLYYQIGDVFVSASQSETQGLTFIEAMAAGLPVVAKKDPCLEEILVDGYNGYAFTDSESMIKGLDDILFSGRDKEELKKNSIHMVKNYSVETFGESVEKVYEKVVRASQVVLQA